MCVHETIDIGTKKCRNILHNKLIIIIIIIEMEYTLPFDSKVTVACHCGT